MLHQLLRRIALPPTGLVLFSIASTQIGSAIAKSLLDQITPSGMVLLRVGLAAGLLLLLWRPPIRAALRARGWLVLLFGASLALMNLSFYEAIARIPIGIAVALEFIGPLGVAVCNSRKLLDVLWVVLAGLGIVLVTPIGGFTLNLAGIGFALLAGAFWAAYILLSARTGKALPGGSGLAIALTLGTLILLPFGGSAVVQNIDQPQLLLMGFGVALLSSAIPYSFELEALRTMPVRVFGILLSLEPMMAAIAGFIILGETLTLRSVIAIVLVTVAAAGSSRFSDRKLPSPSD